MVWTDLTAAVAEELVQSFDEMLQPGRLSLADPALRIAFGCSSFIDKALNDPRWASLVARMAAAAPKGGELLRRRLFEDLQQFSKSLPGSGASAELNLEIVVGIMLQLMRALGERRLSSLDRDAAVSAILRAIGLNAAAGEVGSCAIAWTADVACLTGRGRRSLSAQVRRAARPDLVAAARHATSSVICSPRSSVLPPLQIRALIRSTMLR